MIKLFEEWATSPEFTKISSQDFADNDDSVEFRDNDIKRIEMIFTGFKFIKDNNPYIHMTDVTWTDTVYLFTKLPEHLLIWKDEANYFYVCFYSPNTTPSPEYFLPIRPFQIYFYKCDWLEGLQGLRDYLYDENNF